MTRAFRSLAGATTEEAEHRADLLVGHDLHHDDRFPLVLITQAVAANA